MPTPIDTLVPSILTGQVDYTINDATGRLPYNIIDSTVTNSISVDWSLKGQAVLTLEPTNYKLMAYFDAQELGGADKALPTQPAGPQLISSFTNEFGVPGTAGHTLSYSLNIPIAPGSVPQGVYRVSLVLTHETAPASPWFAGFLDLGVIQVF
jgi:hypothetical protein